MATEQSKTLEALQSAIHMEIDGKEFYLKASQKSSNDMGKKLLNKLALEEDFHRQKFEQIYDAISKEKAWPETDFKSDGGSALRTIFASTLKEGSLDTNAAITELDSVQAAMIMENKTYDFYKSQGKDATYSTERDFYEALAAQEREHYLILLDYYEFLKDPAAWFVEKEHPSMDGG
ncbi:ferritin family protein [Chloroflexota bacterium]